jgi:hypothetical protein
MIKHIVCWGRNKIKVCYYHDIKAQDEDIRIAELCLKNISELQRQIDNCIRHNTIEEFLRINGEYISQLYWQETKENEWNMRMKDEIAFDEYMSDSRKNCKLKPKQCVNKYYDNKNYLNRLLDNLDSKIEKYNKQLSIIKKVKK